MSFAKPFQPGIRAYTIELYDYKGASIRSTEIELSPSENETDLYLAAYAAYKGTPGASAMSLWNDSYGYFRTFQNRDKLNKLGVYLDNILSSQTYALLP